MNGRLLVVVAAVVGCGLLTAAAFWLLEVLLDDGIPHPLWGFVAGAGVAVLSYVRTGWSDRRDARRAR